MDPGFSSDKEQKQIQTASEERKSVPNKQVK